MRAPQHLTVNWLYDKHKGHTCMVLTATQMISEDLSYLSSDGFSSLFFFMVVINKCQQLVYTNTSIYSNQPTLATDVKH